jgi:molybdate transport system substrate-binding protein
MRRSTRSGGAFATVVAVVVVALAAAAGCGSDGTASNGAAGSGSASADPAATPVTVFAASSLTGTFTSLAHAFESAHPGARVKLNVAASSTLARQIVSGAPADVFASASTATMKQVAAGGAVASGPTTFASNTMEIAVPPGNPAKITSIDDLARPGIKVALCEVQVPCGATGAAALKKAGVTVTPATYGADVKGVLSLVELGEVDAALVYRTDVLAAGKKALGVEIPPARDASTDYPVAALTSGDHEAAGKAFVDLVLSSTGQRVLSEAGFSNP